jgi:penicillin-binding protein 1C
LQRGAVVVGVLAIGVLVVDRLFPLPARGMDAGLVVVAEDGLPLRTWPSRDGVWRYPVRPDEVSPYYLQALLGYEDRWFYYHPGVNPVAMLRAASQWIRSGRIVSGGSTLTMQVARMIDPVLRQPGSRKVGDKLRQMARAVQLELHYSKAEILGLYLAHAPMGGIVEGVEMASRAYLGKPSAELSLADAALLAGLPQAPSRLRPDREPEAAQRARDKVLQRMADQGIWTAAEVADARIETVVAQPLRARWLAPLAAERMRQQASPGRRRAGVLRTTLNPETQSIVEHMLMDRVDSLPPKVSMAVLVMDNESLAVRAYAGSADFSDAKRYNHVDMVRGVRSPGSTLKPFLYGMALDQGLIHSESLLVDAPQSFGGYQPGNFQASFTGAVSVSQALQRSLNVPAVDVLDRVGPAYFASTLRAAGVRLRMPQGASPNLSLILGGGGTTLEELVGAYRSLAHDGLAGTPRMTPQAPRNEFRLMSPGAAFIVRDILEGGGQPDRARAGTERGIAWKTGTSFGFRDAWAIGVTDTWTIGVWVGRPDGTPNPGFFGANVAAPLLRDIVAALPAGAAVARVQPASVNRAEICWPLGLPAHATLPEHCQVRRAAWTLDGAIPPTLPDRLGLGALLETVWIDPKTGLRTRPDCRVAGEAHELANWPSHLRPWLAAQVGPAALAPAWHPDCVPSGGAGNLRIVGLDDNATLQPVPGARELSFNVEVLNASGPVYWLLDGQVLNSDGSLGGAEAALGDPATSPAMGDARSRRLRFSSAGAHALTVLDEAGRYDRVPFQIRGLPPS